MSRVFNVKMSAFMLSSFVWGIHNVEVACKATDVKLKLRVKQQMLINAVCSTRPGGVLELSTFNYFFAGAFFAGVVFCSS